MVREGVENGHGGSDLESCDERDEGGSKESIRSVCPLGRKVKTELILCICVCVYVFSFCRSVSPSFSMPILCPVLTRC